MNEDAFHSALHDNPSDEVTWLALADWLDDDGQSGRELVRAHRQLLALPPTRRPPQRARLEERIAQLLDANTHPVVPQRVNALGMRFSLIPAGVFRMGSLAAESGRSTDEKAHKVEITRPFYLSVFPVTQVLYEAVMGINPAAHSPSGRNRSRVKKVDTSNFPVEQVPWTDAALFCQRLTQREPAHNYRLPTEAEWELACRAGTLTPFHQGNMLSSTQANFDGSRPHSGAEKGPYLSRPSPVGSYPPNAWGLYDLHGNILEWCSDWYDRGYYSNSARKDPAGPPTGQCRAARGGCWFFPASAIRSACRNYFTPLAVDSCVGFRVAIDADRA